jgi:dihydrofolate reductase
MIMKNPSRITGIMACDPNGLIGNNGSMPWKNEEETRYFRSTTKGHTLIMGNNTFKSSHWDTSNNIVFSRDQKARKDNTIFINSIESFLNLNIPENEKIFMIGGAQIAHLFLQHQLISEFLLTKMKKKYTGDAFLDLNLLQNWRSSVFIEHEEYTVYRLTKGDQL